MPSGRKSTPPPTPPDPDLPQWHPRAIGPYHILRVLGEGGMGTVYFAEQREPIRRQIALKVIKLGQDTKEVLARFEQERQALSMMNHPCIARVLDAGATDDGRPYFVMEYVPGVRITDYCDQNRLSLRDRLALFTEVCAGIQHAHQKGIIHRDMKPSNILVTVEENRPLPKIIDFGLALAIEQKLTDRSLHTRAGQWIGTPEYMSPEQAGQTGDIDTRADIYSLGVLLYELLTGHLPFESWSLREGGLAEIQRTIQEKEPPKPSTRVSVVADRAETAARRRTDPSTLRKRLRGDLDWIVMRALEKERRRRYASASELAADVRHHLANEPVLAGPPAWSYRTGKFLRRYRLQVATLVVVLMSLVGGIIVAWNQYVRAEENARIAARREGEAQQERRAAQRAATDARTAADEANQARDRLSEQHDIALREYRRADELLQKFQLLSYVSKLEQARRSARTLYPAWPENVSRLRDWLVDYRPLASETTRVRTAIREIRDRLVDYEKQYGGRYRDVERTFEALKRSTGSWLEGALDIVGDVRKQQMLAQLRLLENLWIDRFLVDTLEQLVDDLDRFRHGEVADVRDRLVWASEVQRLSIGDHEAAWREASDAIAASDDIRASARYRGLRLSPQLGLIPVGMDPTSKLWEFVHLRSGDDVRRIPAREPTTGALQLTPRSGAIFVLVPGDTCRYGAQSRDPRSPNHDPAATEIEGPPGSSDLAPFFVAKHELTQGQWLRLAGAGSPSLFDGSARDRHPVENVSWHECRELLSRHGLDLPTEAQWEHCARGGTTTAWPSGDLPGSLAGTANLDDAWLRGATGGDDGFATTAPVGSFRPNGFGLHDVCGNVWEWCRDGEGSYREPAESDDGLRENPDAPKAVIRGGCWELGGNAARAAHREFQRRDSRSDTIGVRPMRPIY